MTLTAVGSLWCTAPGRLGAPEFGFAEFLLVIADDPSVATIEVLHLSRDGALRPVRWNRAAFEQLVHGPRTHLQRLA